MKSYLAATIQMWVGKDRQENLGRCLEKLDEAAGKGAKLIVFPESVNGPRKYDTREEAHQNAVPIPGEFTDEICKRAALRGVHVALNLNEKAEFPQVYSTTILVSSKGEILGKYRKQILWADENNCFFPARWGFPVFETELGRIGMYICADGLIPETTRCLALNGAQVLVNMLVSKGPDESMLHIPARSFENGVWIISANQVGQPGELRPCIGGGLIMSPMGEIVAEASETHEDIAYGAIRPDEADDKSLGKHNDLLSDRRPDLYRLLCEPTEKLPLIKCIQETDASKARLVKVAAVQVDWKQDADYAVSRAVEIAESAASIGAKVMVLPELFPFKPESLSRDAGSAAEFSLCVLERFKKLAKSHSTCIALNLVEKEGSKLYSTVFLVDDGGEVCGKYRKTHLWGEEKEWAKAGEGLRVFPTRYGNIGVMIGYEALIPEVSRVLTCMGADLIVHPCTWSMECVPELTMKVRAAENHLHIVSASRPDSPVKRGSMIVAVDRFPTQPHWKVRHPMVHEAPPGREFYVALDLDLNASRQKIIGQQTDVILQRHPDLYEILAKPV